MEPWWEDWRPSPELECPSTLFTEKIYRLLSLAMVPTSTSAF